jgi:hypothetical protein
MSSPLYAVTVSSLRGDAVHLDLRSVCEAGCFTISRLFAANLLYEPFSIGAFRRPGVVWRPEPDGPLRRRFSADELCDWAGSGVPGSEESRLVFVRDVAYGSLRNVPVVATPPDPDGFHRTGIRFGDPRFPAAAKAYHAALDPLFAQASTLSPSRMPSAVLRIQVDEPKWLSHLAVGMLWDSYAFDDEGPNLY